MGKIQERFNYSDRTMVEGKKRTLQSRHTN